MTKEDFIRGLNEDLVAEWGVPSSANVPGRQVLRDRRGRATRDVPPGGA